MIQSNESAGTKWAAFSFFRNRLGGRKWQLIALSGRVI
jgi:hypothetical protein